MKQHLWIAPYILQKDNSIEYNVFIVFSNTEKEALDFVYKQIHEQYPISKGYSNHSVMVRLVTDDIIITAYTNLRTRYES